MLGQGLGSVVPVDLQPVALGLVELVTRFVAPAEQSVRAPLRPRPLPVPFALGNPAAANRLPYPRYSQTHRTLERQ